MSHTKSTVRRLFLCAQIREVSQHCRRLSHLLFFLSTSGNYSNLRFNFMIIFLFCVIHQSLLISFQFELFCFNSNISSSLWTISVSSAHISLLFRIFFVYCSYSIIYHCNWMRFGKMISHYYYSTNLFVYIRD